MQDKYIHIVTFDIPYPPNYGGVIDVFYKIKALHEEGVKVHLHCFEYLGREKAIELQQYCETIRYYKRKTGFLSAFNCKPYIVNSRRSDELLKNLTEHPYPILFEGMHSCYYLNHPQLQSRIKIYRESNIEHHYYWHLCKAEKNIIKKVYFFIESLKLYSYQRILKHAEVILAVSSSDVDYLQKKLNYLSVYHLPSFHVNNAVTASAGKGQYVLYHGNIEVPENAKAVKYLIKNVFSDLSFPLVVAGMNPSKEIAKLIMKHPNIKLIANPSDEQLFNLIKHAHIHVMFTFQATGLKLKLLNALYKGRFVLVNAKMVEGTNLPELCFVVDEALAMKKKITELFDLEFSNSEIEKRMQLLEKYYSVKKNIEQLIKICFTKAD